jgi:DNA-directed RNA polymerase subunit L
MEPVFHDMNKSRANTLTFRLSPTNHSYANTLVRLCKTAVEVVGFRADMNDKGDTTDVTIQANSTPMTNEMLAHRVGLVPVFCETPTKWDPEQYKFVLDVSNTTKDFRDVYASDFRVLEKKGDDYVDVPSSRFFAAHPVSGETSLIAVLKPQMPGAKPEEIHLEARATVGVGRENARFNPTSQCAYGYSLDKDPEHLKKVFDDWLGRAKMLNPSAIEQDAEKKAILLREFNTLEVNRCYLKNDKGEAYSFDFTVESVGTLTPEYIVARACEAGVEMCERYTSEALSGDVVVQFADCKLFAYDFIFQKQDHTLGNLITTWLDANLVGNGEITYAGYDIPHPLRDEMVIRIGVDGQENQETVARKALRDAMTACATMFRSWRSEWSQSANPQASSKPKIRRQIVRPLPSVKGT